MSTKNEQVSTKDENANPKYIFRHKDGFFSEVITYKTNLVQEIQKDENAKENAAIQTFRTKSVTDAQLERFIRIAKEAGYTIYKVMEL